MAQNTLAAPPVNPVLQKWIASHAGSINRVANTLGIPAAALASGPAEEASHIISAWPRIPGTNIHPFWQNLRDSAQDQLAALIWSFRYENDFLARESDIVSGKKPSVESGFWRRVADYIIHPTKNDVGWGNINVGSARLYLDMYLAEVRPGGKYEGDPLNLAQYKNNYRKMAEDLGNWENDLTFKIAGLVIKRADDVFANFYDNQYLLLPEDQLTSLK